MFHFELDSILSLNNADTMLLFMCMGTDDILACKLLL